MCISCCVSILGLNHQYTTKYKRIYNDLYTIGSGTDGESRMGGGGTVYSTSESTRYKDNGHFGPCAKDHFGWLEDEHIVTISPWDNVHDDDEDSNDDDDNEQGVYTLNAYDRPDVIPSDPQTIAATGSDIFLLKIEYGSQYEYYENLKLNRIYIYYRTSAAGPDAGVSVQYCLLSQSNAESGGAIQTYTYDVSGNTQIQHDHYIDVGQSFVVQPFIWSLEDNVWSNFVNPLAAQMHLPNITVLSVGDGWKDCSADTYICNVTHPNIAITVQVDWIDPEKAVMSNNSNSDPFDLIDVEVDCESDSTESLQINTTETKYKVIHVRTEEVGIYGRGTAKLNFCADNAHLQAFFYDLYPYNFLNQDVNDDLGIGALMSYPFTGNMAGYSCSYPDCAIQAVQVVQMEDSSLHLAEIQIYDAINGTNIANQSNCYTFPGDGDVETDLVDGDLDSYSHSDNAQKGNFDVCVFEDGASIKQVKVWPRDAWYVCNIVL